MPVACPSENALKEFLEGKLDEPMLSAFSDHLIACPECQARAKTIPPFDTFLEPLRTNSAFIQEIVNRTPVSLAAQAKSISGNASVATSETESAIVLELFGPPQSSEELGRLGEYRVLSLLGHGGMGAVFLAHDPGLDRMVALKVMLPRFAALTEAKQRFLREGKIVANLKSDHIVQVFQVGEERGVPFLAMELLQGQSLEQKLRVEARPTVHEILRIGREAALGLCAAHEQGLVHRDIKPSNLWLEARGQSSAAPRVKLLDFGLARREKDDVGLTQAGVLVGTPLFMAPEQAKGDKNLDARADLFSLGCVLYYLCTGSVPFQAETTMHVLASLAMDTPIAPDSLNKSIPTSLSNLVMDMLAKRPEHRPRSAREVVETLEACEGEISGRKATPQTKARKGIPSYARRWAVSLAALLLLFGASFAVFQLFFRTPNGTLVVEFEGNDAELRLRQGRLHILDSKGKDLYILEPNEKNKELPVGKYMIQVTGATGLKLNTDRFEMTRTGAKVTVTMDRSTLAKNDPPKAISAIERSRQTAEWVLSLGGWVVTNDSTEEIHVLAKLPKSPFELTYVQVRANRLVKNSDIGRFADLPLLKGLWIDDCSIDDAGFALLKNVPALEDLNLGGTPITSAGLLHLTTLPHLKTLRLAQTKIMDADLDLLKKLPGLEALELYGTSITDAGVARLKHCPRLRNVVLGSTPISDAALRHLKELPELTDLALLYASITDEGLAHLKDCPTLMRLNLGHTKVTDRGLAHLKNLKMLTHLWVERTGVTDVGLEAIQGFSELRHLNISHSKVSDAGLRHLKTFAKLQNLDLRDTQVTRAAALNFQAGLPGCRIEHSTGALEPKR